MTLELLQDWLKTIKHNIYPHQYYILTYPTIFRSTEEINYLAKIIKYDKYITSLMIHGSYVDNIKHIVYQVKKNINLDYISIAGTTLLDNNIKYISNMLKHNAQLKYLNLPRTKLSEQGLKYLVNGLICNQHLLGLDLCGNIFKTTNCMKNIMCILKYNKSIHTLDISSTMLQNIHGIKYITHALKYNKSLHTLTLCNNKLSTIDAIYIAKLLRNNSNLETLNLNWCFIPIEGSNYIIKSLKYSTKLQYFYFCGNCIDTDTIRYLTHSLKYNNVLKEIYLQYQHDIDIGKYINKQLHYNYSITYLTYGKGLFNPTCNTSSLNYIFDRNKHNINQKNMTLVSLLHT